MRNRLIIKLLAAATVFSAAFAMAASLGGITSNKLGADDAAVASCDTDGVTTAYTSSWDTTDKRYEVSSVTVSNVSDTCDGQTLQVTVADSSNVQLGEGTLAIPTSAATSHTVTLSSAASSELAANVHVTIA
jgi:uncharacterized membrane-anchored protein